MLLWVPEWLYFNINLSIPFDFVPILLIEIFPKGHRGNNLTFVCGPLLDLGPLDSLVGSWHKQIFGCGHHIEGVPETRLIGLMECTGALLDGPQLRIGLPVELLYLPLQEYTIELGRRLLAGLPKGVDDPYLTSVVVPH